MRYPLAHSSRFSVNLRVIPVISCLENHAVVLMLHCLSSLPSLHSNWGPYNFQSTPTILTVYKGSHSLAQKDDQNFTKMDLKST